MNLNAQQFLQAAKALEACTQKNGGTMADIHIDIGDEGVILTATNGFMLHRVTLADCGGRYPNCDKAMPREYSARVTVNRNKFAKYLKTTDDQIVTLCQSGNNGLAISNGEESPLTLAAEFSGVWERIAFSTRCLLFVVKSLNAEEITLSSAGPLGVCRITSALCPDDDATFFLLMPCRQ